MDQEMIAYFLADAPRYLAERRVFQRLADLDAQERALADAVLFPETGDSHGGILAGSEGRHGGLAE